MKLSANHFIPWKKLRKKFLYSTRSNQLFRTHDFPCLYMKKNQSSLHNKLEELTSDRQWLWSPRLYASIVSSKIRKKTTTHIDLVHLMEPNMSKNKIMNFLNHKFTYGFFQYCSFFPSLITNPHSKNCSFARTVA